MKVMSLSSVKQPKSVFFSQSLSKKKYPHLCLTHCKMHDHWKNRNALVIKLTNETSIFVVYVKIAYD